ncbi:unnamed protein product [Amoebophrya sp. A120]|nr:unnamed protein product [Amoebophrya sp. A120]|eukprot:GSA120T00003667001.1
MAAGEHPDHATARLRRSPRQRRERANAYPSWPAPPPFAYSNLKEPLVRNSEGRLRVGVGSRDSFSDEEMLRVKNLHLDWFPVRYDQNFYEDVQRGKVLSITAHTNSTPEGESAKKIVGLLCLRYDLAARADVPLALGLGPRFLYIATLGVAQQARGLGLAKALVQHGLNMFEPGRSCSASTSGCTTAASSSVEVGLSSSCWDNSSARRITHVRGTTSHDDTSGRAVEDVHPATFVKADEGNGSCEATTIQFAPAKTDAQRFLENTGQRSDFVGIYLHVISFNTQAQRLYEKMGFQFYRTQRDFYYLNDRHWDAYTYVYLFDKKAHGDLSGSRIR